VRPRKLGHAVLGSTDYAASTAFFNEGLGFKVSDRIKGRRRVHALFQPTTTTCWVPSRAG